MSIVDAKSKAEQRRKGQVKAVLRPAQGHA